MSKHPKASVIQSVFKNVQAGVIKVGTIIQSRGILIVINLDPGLSGQRAAYSRGSTPDSVTALDKLRKQDPDLVTTAERRFWLLVTLVLGGSCTFGTLFLREQGVFQPLELNTFDYLVRLRPPEKPDPRLLVVTVTESDIQKYQQGSISDSTLSQLLMKLEEDQPRVIGLDIYRDFPVGTGRQELLSHFKNPKLITTCAGSTRKKKGVPASPGVFRERLGFSDVAMDNDGVLRRHLLAMQPDLDSPCKTYESLSFQLALHYLARQGIQPNLTEKEEYRIGNVIFTPLAVRRGSYRRLDTRGYQVFLNYRALQSPEQVAERITLSEVLNGRVDPRRIRDRVVLIGVSAESVKDNHLTPYSNKRQPPQRMPGVFIHAQMVSQVLSAVLDDRPLLWVWPDWAEVLWIVGWSVLGGVVGLVVRPFWLIGLVGLGVLGVLVGLCWVGLLYGGWLPLIPPALALLITNACVVLAEQRSQSQNRISSENL